MAAANYGSRYEDAPAARLTVLDSPLGLPHRLGKRFFVGVLLGVVVTVPSTMTAQRYFLLKDDSERGARYAQTFDTTPAASDQDLFESCLTGAKAFYGHGLIGASEPGWPRPNVKAFVVGCSGMTMGGLGGGQEQD